MGWMALVTVFKELRFTDGAGPRYSYGWPIRDEVAERAAGTVEQDMMFPTASRDSTDAVVAILGSMCPRPVQAPRAAARGFNNTGGFSLGEVIEPAAVGEAAACLDFALAVSVRVDSVTDRTI